MCGEAWKRLVLTSTKLRQTGSNRNQWWRCPLITEGRVLCPGWVMDCCGTCLILKQAQVKDWSTKCDLRLCVSAAGNALLQLSLQLWLCSCKKDISDHWQGQFTYFSHAEFCLSYCMSIVQVLKLGQERGILTCMSLAQTEFEAKSCAHLYQGHGFLIAFRTEICWTVFPLLSFLWYFKAVTDCDLAKMGQKI